MRVYEARHDDASVRIEPRLIGIGSPKFGSGTHGDDLFIAKHNCAIFDDAQRAKRVAPLRSAGEGEELGGRVNEHEKFQPLRHRG
jgi:hypothetical protein